MEEAAGTPEMSQPMAVFILMSNYFHDVATAMLVACSFSLWVILTKYGQQDETKRDFFARLYRAIKRIVIFSWIWIVSAGAIRIATFRSFEWVNAVEKHHETALIVKYVVAAVMIIGGSSAWIVLRRKAESLLVSKR